MADDTGAPGGTAMESSLRASARASAAILPDTLLEPGRNCWTVVTASKLSVIVDAAEYYRYIHGVMERAKERILIIGWDFDTRIPLIPKNNGKGEALGRFFLRLAKRNPNREIDILKWNLGALKQFLHYKSIYWLYRWWRSPVIEFHFDSAHPSGCSHHQKIVVIDDWFAVCGGIDIAGGRWDTPAHLDHEPRRKLPNGKAFPPWHDVTVMLEGEAAGTLGDLGRDRWRRATRTDLAALESKHELWPDDLPVMFENVEIAIARTRAQYNDIEEIREIETLYLDMIAAAKKFIYIENQYFTNGKIGAAIAQRMEEPEPPEIVLVMPRTADGWLEQKAMDGARVQLTRAIGKADPNNHFRIYVPQTAGGTDIYVHAKVMIVDDMVLRVGSSNLNNRSMGLDSECDVVIDSNRPGNEKAAAKIAKMRAALMAEHLGVEPEQVEAEFAQTQSLLRTIEALNGRGSGKKLDLLDLIAPSALDEFIAQNEILDPDHPDKFFEPLSARGLKRSWHMGKAYMSRFGFRRRKKVRP